MITKKAKKLSQKAQSLSYGRNISDEKYKEYKIACLDCYEEIFSNCCPTKEEWAELVSHLLMETKMIWDFVLYVPYWERKNGGKVLY